MNRTEDVSSAETSRSALIKANVIHDFDADVARQNLRGSYGLLMRRRYEKMLPLIKGRRVLDAGCGIGLFSAVCRDAGIDITSIDLDVESQKLAWETYGVAASCLSVYDTQLPDNSIDAVALFDVIEHLDFAPLFGELRRLGVSRALLYDSNISNPILRWYRQWVGHSEHVEYTMKEVVSAFEHNGFKLMELKLENSLMMPLTGGLQRSPIPVLGSRISVVEIMDCITTGGLRLLRLDRLFCFRYFAIFDRLVEE